MSVSVHFSQSYREAREKFLAAASNAGIETVAYQNPNAVGPEGEILATDVAMIGPADASRLLILISSTHGCEGFCGSGSQIALLHERAFSKLGDDTAVLFIHAINPYGFAHGRRVNEDNVDLNRNSIDHSHPPSTHPDFDLLAPSLLPTDWDGPARAAADIAIHQYIAEKGMRTFQEVFTGGQYTHADNMFYGGKELVWSTRTYQSILSRFAGAARRVGIVDFHTGLGPEGYGEPIYTAQDGDERARAERWYGAELTSIYAGDSTSAIVQGPMINATRWALPHAALTPIGLEFGTLDMTEVLEALRAEHWLVRYGTVDSPQGRDIKRRFRDSLYVDTDSWKDAIVERARDITGKALVGLAE